MNIFFAISTIIETKMKIQLIGYVFAIRKLEKYILPIYDLHQTWDPTLIITTLIIFPIGSNAKDVLKKPLFIQSQPTVSVFFSKSSF